MVYDLYHETSLREKEVSGAITTDAGFVSSGLYRNRGNYTINSKRI
jgi:hypothetical protein